MMLSVLRGDVIWEGWPWVLLASVPVLAFFTAKAIYNAVCVSRHKERLLERDLCYDLEFRNWWGSVQAHRGIQRAFCTMELEADEVCYLYSGRVSVFSPDLPSDEFEIEPQSEEGVAFDVDCGVCVSPNWSVMDWFPSVSFQGSCVLCVTNKYIRLFGGGIDLEIGLEEIRMVAAACSSVLIETRNESQPLLLGSVNGQIVRDILHILVDEEQEMRPW